MAFVIHDKTRGYFFDTDRYETSTQVERSTGLQIYCHSQIENWCRWSHGEHYDGLCAAAAAADVDDDVHVVWGHLNLWIALTSQGSA